MFWTDIEIARALIEKQREEVDRLCQLSYQGRLQLEASQALLAASWSLRAATFALSLASKTIQKLDTSIPAPSSMSATGGSG